MAMGLLKAVVVIVVLAVLAGAVSHFVFKRDIGKDVGEMKEKMADTIIGIGRAENESESELVAIASMEDDVKILVASCQSGRPFGEGDVDAELTGFLDQSTDESGFLYYSLRRGEYDMVLSEGRGRARIYSSSAEFTYEGGGNVSICADERGVFAPLNLRSVRSETQLDYAGGVLTVYRDYDYSVMIDVRGRDGIVKNPVLNISAVENEAIPLFSSFYAWTVIGSNVAAPEANLRDGKSYALSTRGDGVMRLGDYAVLGLRINARAPGSIAISVAGDGVGGERIKIIVK